MTLDCIDRKRLKYYHQRTTGWKERYISPHYPADTCEQIIRRNTGFYVFEWWVKLLSILYRSWIQVSLKANSAGLGTIEAQHEAQHQAGADFNRNSKRSIDKFLEVHLPDNL